MDWSDVYSSGTTSTAQLQRASTAWPRTPLAMMPVLGVAPEVPEASAPTPTLFLMPSVKADLSQTAGPQVRSRHFPVPTYVIFLLASTYLYLRIPSLSSTYLCHLFTCQYLPIPKYPVTFQYLPKSSFYLPVPIPTYPVTFQYLLMTSFYLPVPTYT